MDTLKLGGQANSDYPWENLPNSQLVNLSQVNEGSIGYLALSTTSVDTGSFLSGVFLLNGLPSAIDFVVDTNNGTSLKVFNRIANR